MSTASTEPNATERQSGRIPALLTLITCTAIAALAVWAVFVQVSDAKRMAEVESIAEVHAAIAEQIESDDLVRVLPLWFYSGRQGLHGATFLQSDDLDPWELDLSSRLWLLWSRSHEDEALAEAATLRDFEIVAQNEQFTAGVGAIPHERQVHWDATSSFWDAEVFRVTARGSRHRSCSHRVRGQLHCGGYNRWTYASPGYRETDDTIRRCIRVNAFPDGDAWLFRWDNVELGEHIELQFGNSFEAVRNERGAPVQTELRVDGQVVLSEETPIDAVGFPLVRHDTSARASERAQIELRVRADNHLDRFFCLRARTVSTATGAR